MPLVLCRKINNVCCSWCLYLLFTAVLGFLIQIQLKLVIQLTADNGKTHVFHFDRNLDDSFRDVIISGYNYGGCDLVGEVLGTRPDTFYMYEPLIAMAEAYYFKNSTTMCTTLLDKCYKTTLTESAVRRMTHMLSCNTNIIEDKYHHKWDTGGEYWLKYHECLLDKDYDKEFCDRFLSDRCKEAKFKVIKTPRLSTQILKTLLQGHSNVTIVHVFRDPRGILFQIMSENSDQAPVSALRKYANSLCSRMRDDLEVGFKLASLYPKRFKLMLFEDFEWDMVTVFKPLFRFVGFPLYRKDKSFVEAISQKKALTEYIKETGNKTRPDSSQQEVLKIPNINPFQWRKQIDVNNLKIVDEYCGDLYIKLGYNVYANVENLRNLSDWSSYGADGVYPL